MNCTHFRDSIGGNFMSNSKTKVEQLTVTAILSAIVIIVSFLPLKTMGLEISFAMVPVAVGAILYGPSVGAVLGGVFGIVSFLQCFGYSAFGTLILGENFLLTMLVCIPTSILDGILTGLIFKGIHSFKNKTIKELSYPISS
ncbi:MAG: ECF transporter S component, partial [Clostridia bacterium]|nr:ECF transporter S component [Clostridia bacterium]